MVEFGGVGTTSLFPRRFQKELVNKVNSYEITQDDLRGCCDGQTVREKGMCEADSRGIDIVEGGRQ